MLASADFAECGKALSDSIHACCLVGGQMLLGVSDGLGRCPTELLALSTQHSTSWMPRSFFHFLHSL